MAIKISSNAPLKAAKQYRKQGWQVLALHGVDGKKCLCGEPSCKTPGKHPRTPHGVRDATSKKRTIINWFSEAPSSNIGIATGEKSKLLVLDIDIRHGGEETLKKAIETWGPLPETLTAITGGGHHLYFKMPDAAIKKDTSGKLIGAGVDVLTNGCYVVAPGSRHASGKAYEWKHGGPETRPPAQLPAKWVERLTGSTITLPAPNRSPGAIGEGQRNTELTSFVGKLVRSSISFADVLAAARDWNARNCAPPLDNHEVEKVVQSVTKYADNTGDPGEYLLNTMLHQHFAGGEHLVLGTDGQFWSYDGRRWSPCNEDIIKGKILDTIRSLPVKQLQNKGTSMRQAMDLLRPMLSLLPGIDLTKPLPSVINCLNGELWIVDNGEVELRPHSPKSFLRHCLDIEYDQAAVCPMYDKAVTEIFALAKKPDDLIRHWNEIAGYLIQPTRKIPLILILYGGGGNGKTQLIKLVASLMGENLVLWDRISQAATNRFFFGSLAEKLMLVDDDVTIGTRLPDGELKKISEEKVLSGERKFGQTFNFTCLAAPVLLCNSPMSLSDVGAGMQRRLMVIPFERQFKEGEIDRTLFTRIKTNELPGILNRAIEGYQRIVRRGNSFERPKAVINAGKRWFDEANPIATFVAERCERDITYSQQVTELYSAYTEWAEAAGIKLTQQKTNFSRNLQNYLGAGKKKASKGTKIIGIRLKKKEGF
jgi:P4 family phage/plasmid primase-like protien